MGLFDFLTGSKSAPSNVARQPVEHLRQAMLSLNRETAPFQVRDGAAEGVDLVAEWKIVDARWYEVFAKAGLSSVFRVLMKFDAEKGEVRSQDQEWTVEWRAGVPSLTLAASSFQGQKTEISFGKAYAFTEVIEHGKLEWGQVYNYAFRTGEIKAPLQQIAAAEGWGWKGIAFGRL